jgi:hypothetical protein
MACNNCTKTNTIVTNCTSGCKSTINADCVIYDGSVLSFESDSVNSGDKRTLSSLLDLIQVNVKESKILAFNSDGTTDNGTSYTVLEEDTNNIILFTQTDDGTPGTVTYTITLPQTSSFLNKELIFKDISEPSGGGVTIEYVFSIDIQYDWNPLTVSADFATLMDATHKTLKLRFIKTTPSSYQWIVCP